ncbi:MAG TPA: GNAT family N-acetyltransferase [Herpetosiphonaceae bacterium]|nr:GNAT family N-acetyltransferase [Herpetosiphonaceae bacterium]
MQIETPRGPLTLRQFALEDLDRYRALRLEALGRHPEVYGGDHATEAARSEEAWRDRAAAMVGSDSQTMFVAEAGGALVGMTGIFRGFAPKLAHGATIYSVYVRPEWRGARITDHLIERCLDWARPLGVTIVYLAVVTSNASAIRCYARCGFSAYGVQPAVIHHAGQYHDELLMMRRI